jgi:lipoprotein-releasing system permease protein
MLIFSLAWNFVKSSWKSQLAVTTRLSLAGFVLGTMSLVVAMSVVSGFEETLYESVTRLNGHIQIRGPFNGNKSDSIFYDKINERFGSHILGITPVLWVEALAISKGATQGVLLQGLSLEQAGSVLDFSKVMKEDFSKLEPQQVWIGLGLAKKWGLSSGDQITIVVPISDEMNPQKLKRSFKTFEVRGVLSLGKHEYDERIVIMNIDALQSLAQVGAHFSGVLLQTSHRTWALDKKVSIQSFLGSQYRVQSWYDINSYLFEAIEIERYVIFVVILIIVIASSFNVGVSLWIGVLQKTKELSLLKVMGLPPSSVQGLMLLQGLLMAFVGALWGLFLGIVLSFGVDWIQSFLPLLPGSVYKIDHLETKMKIYDLSLILGSVVLLSGLAIFWPARNAARQKIGEGLRYE